MSYCINPDCCDRQNLDDAKHCLACGTSLLIKDRYRLIEPLRSLDPYRTTDVFLVQDGDRQKVMKVLHQTQEPKLVELFLREARTLQLHNHPGMPAVDRDGYFKIKTSEGRSLHCLVMEKIDGINLETWVQQHGRLSQKLALNWFRQLIDILDYLHSNGIFHRDIKPSNIIRRKDGKIVLIDFGSVRNITPTYWAKLGSQFEQTQIISEGYTSPEQREGQSLPQSDFYALGRTFVHLLTAIPPTQLPIFPETKLLNWRSHAPHVAQPFADFIDQLMFSAAEDRPQTTLVITKNLNRINVFFRQCTNFVRSPRGIATLITVGLVGMTGTFLGVYRYSQLITDKQQEASLHAEEGRTNLVNNNLAAAQASLELAVSLDPRNSRHHNDLGLVCSYLKDYDCATEHYQRAIELDPTNEDVAVTEYNLANAYEWQTDYERAIEQYADILQTYPDSEMRWYAASNLARLEIWRNFNPDEAIALIIPAEQQLSDHIATLANSSDETDQESVGYLTSLQGALLKNLGWAYLQQANYPDAETTLNEALQLDGDRAASHCLLAQVLEAQARENEAIAPWQSCLDYTSEFGEPPEVVTWQGIANQRLNTEEN